MYFVLVPSVETVTLSEYVAEYEQMWKWMVLFLFKFLDRGINIAGVYSIRGAKPMILFPVLRVVALQVTSSWAIMLFALSLHLPLLSL